MTSAELFRSHIVVGVTLRSAGALAEGFRLAVDRDCPLAMVTVVEHLEEGVWFDDQLLETHLVDVLPAAEMLAAAVEPYHLRHPNVAVRRAVLAGPAPERLVEAGKNAECLVIGNSRKVGATTRFIISQAVCPVLLVAPRSHSDSSGAEDILPTSAPRPT